MRSVAPPRALVGPSIRLNADHFHTVLRHDRDQAPARRAEARRTHVCSSHYDGMRTVRSAGRPGTRRHSTGGVALRYLAIQSPPEIFARMVKTRSFDVAEMSLAYYMIARARSKFPFVAIPVFPSR